MPEWTADSGLAGLVILRAIAYVVLVAVTIAMGAVVLNLPGPNLVLAPLVTLLGLGAMVGTWWRGR
jgi:hypothetical protein